LHLEDSELDNSILKPTWINDLHKQFIAFYEQIDKTKSKILALKENWDEEGAKRYRKGTWERDFMNPFQYGRAYDENSISELVQLLDNLWELILPYLEGE